MEWLASIGILYIWLILAGYYLLRIIKKLKGFSNVILLFIRFSFLSSIIAIPISAIPISFSKYILVVWFSFTAFLLNILQNRSTSRFDFLVMLLFSLLGVIDTLSKIEIFFPLTLIYVILYTIYYSVSPLSQEIKKILLISSVFTSLGVASITTIFLLNTSVNQQLITAFTIILEILSSYLVVLLDYTKETDIINNDISEVILEKEKEINTLVSKINSINSKLKDCLSTMEVDIDKIEKNKLIELVKDLSSTISEINPIIEFIQKTVKDYNSKIENIVKTLPSLTDNLSRDFSELFSTKQILSETNTNVMTLVKVALDSEKSVMGVAKTIKELRSTAKILTDNLKIFSEISDQSSILSINISVEASKLGSQGSVFSKLSQQAKKFSDTISSSTEFAKRSIKELDSKAEFSEYMIKTLVMSFVEIETNLKVISKNVSSVLEKFESFSNLAENIKKEVEEINKMVFIIPEFSMEVTRRSEDILLNYKKLRKYSDDILLISGSIENSMRNIVNSVKSTSSFIENFISNYK